MTRGSDNYELVIVLITGLPASAKTIDKESARVLLPGLQASTDVKSFQVFSTKGLVGPESFSLSPAFYSKWR